MSDPLMEMSGQIDKPHSPSELVYHAYLMDFTNETLIPVLNRKFDDFERRTEHRIDDLADTFDRELKQRSEVSDVMIGSMDKHLREAERTLQSATSDLKEELKDSRARGETLNRVTIRLENTLERVDKDNDKQESKIAELKQANIAAVDRIIMLESTVAMLQTRVLGMSDLLMGNPSEPGVIGQIKQSNEILLELKAQVTELNRPKGFARFGNWLRNNPTVLVLAIVNLILLARPL